MKRVVSDNGSFITVQRSANSPLDKVPTFVYVPDIIEGTIILRRDRERFSIPETLYGQRIDVITKAIMQDYGDDKESVGVLLLGRKGMGKSLLTEILANKVLDRGNPVLVINKFFPPEFMAELLKQVGPCAVLFEEFGINYDYKQGPKLVPILSDTGNDGVLFVFNSNSVDTSTIKYILDRPQRCKYRVTYGDMDEGTLEAILGDQVQREELKDLYRTWAKDNRVNIDSLMTFIRMTRDFESTEELADYMTILNIPSMVEGWWKLTGAKYDGKLTSAIEIEQRSNNMESVTISVISNDRDSPWGNRSGESNVVRTIVPDSLDPAEKGDKLTVLIPFHPTKLTKFNVEDTPSEEIGQLELTYSLNVSRPKNGTLVSFSLETDGKINFNRVGMPEWDSGNFEDQL